MKRIIALVLVLIFTYNIIGGYLYIMIQKHRVRREMVQNIKKGIPLSELTPLTMTSKNKNDFYWQDAHEFKYNGLMYDIVKTEKVNADTTIFYCITDHQEMKLLAKLEMHKRKSSKQNKNGPFKEVLKIVFNEKIVSHDLKYVLINSKKPVSKRNINFYNSITPEISSPPPNYI